MKGSAIVDNKQENMKKLVEQVQELSEKSKEISETIDYVKMPIGVYLIEKEMAKEREMHLIKTIKVLIGVFAATLALTVIAFVWYLSEYPVVTPDNTYYQEVQSDVGDSTIYDGIKVNIGPENVGE